MPPDKQTNWKAGGSPRLLPSLAQGRIQLRAAHITGSCCLVICVVAAGCATYRPIIDMKGVDSSRYNQDLTECQQYAQQVSAEGHAVAGAVFGALFGAALGAAVGNSDLAREVAAVGAIHGGVSGAALGAQSQVNVIRNCMAGRGYRVLQ